MLRITATPSLRSTRRASQLNGSWTPAGNGFCDGTGGGSALVSLAGVRGGSSNYEVTLKLNHAGLYNGQRHVILLRASNDARYGSVMQGSYYSVEIHHTGDPWWQWIQIGRLQGGVHSGLAGKTFVMPFGTYTLRAYVYGSRHAHLPTMRTAGWSR